MLAPGCCDVASDFLDARIGISDLFGMVFAGLASMQREMETVKADVLEDRETGTNALDSLRDEIRLTRHAFNRFLLALPVVPCWRWFSCAVSVSHAFPCHK